MLKVEVECGIFIEIWNLEFMMMLPLIAFSVILSLVPFSVALSTSVYRCVVWKEAVKIAFVFALFQAGMTALGWLIGFAVKGLLFKMTVPVAVMIIFFIGAKLFLDAFRLGREYRIMAVESRKILMGFALVVSINSTLLGLGLGLLYKDILLLAALIFGMVFIFTIFGVRAGKLGMMNLGKSAEIFAGAGLMAICIVIVLQFLKII